MPNNYITIKATISGDIKKVWDYYTLPEHITKWNFASDDWHCPSATNDLKAGGKYVARMEAKDGSFGFDFEGVYEEIVENKKLSFKMPDSRHVNVNFNQLDNQTYVVLTFDAEEQNPKEMQRDGWQAILNNFKKYVETN